MNDFHPTAADYAREAAHDASDEVRKLTKRVKRLENLMMRVIDEHPRLQQFAHELEKK